MGKKTVQYQKIFFYTFAALVIWVISYFLMLLSLDSATLEVTERVRLALIFRSFGIVLMFGLVIWFITMMGKKTK